MDMMVKLLSLLYIKDTKLQIGYPAYYDNETEFNNIYRDLVDNLKHSDIWMRLNKSNSIQAASKLEELLHKDEWSLHPLIVNGYFSPSFTIVITAGRMLITKDYLKQMLLSYSDIGVSLGHEFTHAFISTLIKIISIGKQLPASSHNFWRNFQRKFDCYVKKYNDYGVNGTLTGIENIAEETGLNIAFAAFLRNAERPKDLKFPNLENFTQNQLFFLNYASVSESTFSINLFELTYRLIL